MIKKCVICAGEFDARGCSKTCSKECSTNLRLKTCRAATERYRNTDHGKTKIREYDNNPENKERARKRTVERRKNPEVAERIRKYQREYFKRPNALKTKREYSRRPEVIEKARKKNKLWSTNNRDNITKRHRAKAQLARIVDIQEALAEAT